MAQTVTDHLGNQLPADLDLFAPAPAEIGPVVSLYSTLRKNESPQARRIQKTLLRAGIGGAIGIAIAMAASSFWPVVIGLAIGALTAARTRHTLTYVGQLGVARFETSDRKEIKRTLLFLFSSARALKRSGTRKYMNGVYTGTSWSAVWLDDNARAVCSQSGEYYLTPKADSPFAFWNMAEIAWSNYLVAGPFQTELERTGSIRFDIKGPDWISVGPGFVELCFGGKVARCNAEDIAAVSLSEGRFTIKRKDAKIGWFSSDGVFGFQYADMPNAMVFTFVVRQLLGIRLS
jgi:hypothetical protein